MHKTAALHRLNVALVAGACASLLCLHAQPLMAQMTQTTSATAAAQALIDRSSPNAREHLLQPMTDEARRDWHYTPRRRAGLTWKAMDATQREATTVLMRSALTAVGLEKLHAVMALEIALRELETFGFTRDPDNYALAIFGTPSEDGAWGWRFEGHHLSLHFTLRGDRYIASLPQFFGANPAIVPRDFANGPRKGTRVLGNEESLARTLLDGLVPEKRKLALFDTRTYGDIVTRNADKVSPLAPVGIAFPDLSPRQQATLLRLIATFAEHLNPELAQARLASVHNGGLESLRFGWAGSTGRGEPFYFRIQGTRFLIEFDNSGGNHVHSVWRNFEGDWGRDALGEHYRRSAAQPARRHRHG